MSFEETNVTTGIRALSVLTAVALIGGAGAPAMAQMPAPVRAMLDAAMASDDDSAVATVARLASETNPEHAEEITALLTTYRTKRTAEKEEKIRQAGIFGNWKGSGELGGFLTAGNTNSSGISGGVSLVKSGIDWVHKFRALADYQSADGVTTRNQWMASYEPNFTLSEGVYAYGLAMYEKDRFQGFSDRTTASGGVGLRLVNDSKVTLDIKGGPAWRRTNWLVEDEATELNTLAGADFMWKLSRGFEFKNNAQALWSSGNSTYNNTSALTGKLAGALSARLSYAVRHETAPPIGSVKTDTITRATLVYDF